MNSPLDELISAIVGEENTAEVKKNLEKMESICKDTRELFMEQLKNVEKMAEEKAKEASEESAKDFQKVKETIDREKKLKEYTERQKRIYQNKVNHGFNTTNVYQEARYILEEVAELMRAIEKHDMANVKEELADIVIFAYGCAEVAGVGDLDEEIATKMALNEKRIYKRNEAGDFIKQTEDNK